MRQTCLGLKWGYSLTSKVDFSVNPNTARQFANVMYIMGTFWGKGEN